jgi:cell division transport system ATP-binding protein
MIIFDQVTKKYPTGDVVLDEVSFEIEPQEMVIISGPSGSGKTTLLRMIIKDIDPTSGRISVDGDELSKLKGKHVPSLRRKVGFVFQDYKVIPERSVFENVALMLEIIGLPKKSIKDRVEHLIDLVGMKGKELLFPRQLSGGELQRVSIARAIAAEPRILLADEPTGNLDMMTGESIVDLLGQINKMGTTVIMTTHNLNYVDKLGSRHIEIEKGKIKKDTKKHKHHKEEEKEEEHEHVAVKKKKKEVTIE